MGFRDTIIAIVSMESNCLINWKNIPRWLGITTPRWMHEAIARRNMPVMAIVAATTAMFSGMLVFYLLTGLPCPIDGFDEVAHETPEKTTIYLIATISGTIIMIGSCIFAVVYFVKKWKHPGLATVVTIVFAFVFALLWVTAESGCTPDRQMLFFSSLEFLLAALIVFDPIISIIYFPVVFARFGVTLSLNGQLVGAMTRDLVYLASISILVCLVVYGLFARVQERDRAVGARAFRDELTGARNRHCLRDDFPAHFGKDVYVMLCDIDDFKHYNDDFDHEVGDNLLVQFFYALREAFGDECVYRYGGDEFLVVSAEFDDDGFRQKANKAAEQLSKVEVDGEDAKLTFSGGFVHDVALDNDAFRDMLHRADANLIEAKRAGKNQVVGP